MSSVSVVIPKSDHFFTKNRNFYRTFFRLAVLIALQNIITYSVNIADNLMLGSYSQEALSGAAVVNQIQYLLQNILGVGLGQAIMIVGSQYWGKRETDPIQKLTGIALRVGIFATIILTLVAIIAPASLVGIFTKDPAIIDQAVEYISILRYTYIIFICSNILLSALRSVQVVAIAFKLTVMTLFINVGINYCLIFGRVGFPAMGIRGAAIGTLIARITEFIVLLIYLKKSKKLPIRFELKKVFQKDRQLTKAYFGVAFPCLVSQTLFSVGTALQTAIFGHLNSDAIAANAMANTMFQYCKMLPLGVASATNVIIGERVGTKDWKNMRGYVHSLQCTFLFLGIISSVILFLISHCLFGLYDLTPQAMIYAKQMLTILEVILIATSYQVPCLLGIISGGGDSKYVMLNDVIYAGCITIPMGLIGAFVLHLGVVPLVIIMNIDQVIKCLSNTLKVNSYSWIKTRTR